MYTVGQSVTVDGSLLLRDFEERIMLEEVQLYGI
jgi:RNase P/RNase MRP subunit p29